MELNKIYNMDCVIGMRNILANESVDLIIADPPYFKVVGEKWDYRWRTEEDYLEWSRKWINEASRVLRKGDTYYYAYYDTLELSTQVEDNGFGFR